ncbi:L,D-transpeptidase family protein [Hymenobacter sp. H14-R3]|uniref:L,D-transpeptidase family protein n=1 Tax=Hymenobacter sp. H14-R3 TaxID=3046308 RepID=UPI0024B9EB77|nr:L,D-transpeptidase family protein [Hymenobacter sp. H14-R3]MDJ0366509.1 L,D-transpeptidase family protein [Hymenobacter sp. H14-R3]
MLRFPAVCFLLCAGSLLLAVPQCGCVPAHEAPAVPAVVQEPGPVAPFIRQLLASALPAGEAAGAPPDGELRAFYGPACAPAWADSAGHLRADALTTLALLARAAEHGLRPANYGVAYLQALRDSLAQPALPLRRGWQLARLDVALSRAALRFGSDLGRGRLHPYTPTAKETAAGAAGQPAAGLRAALHRHAVPAALLANAPANREYRQLQRALAQWLARPVAPDSAVLRQHQYEKVAVNLERWRWEPLADSGYVLINVPAYELVVVAPDSVVRRHRVVVGAPRTPTPTLSSRLTHFTLAPDWHVPRSIATQEMLPRIKQNVGYLASHNYALYDGRGRLVNPARVSWATVTARNFAYTIRQSAGCDNSLGNIVFRFANPYAVYVHDTPQRQYFARPARALSHGCVRLQNPMQLAEYLLRREGNTAPLPSDEACARQPRPHEVHLRQPIALYIRYATCTAENGRLRFLPDIYGRDAAIRRGLFGPVAVAK